MAETTKKSKTAAKPRKPATRKKAAPETTGNVTSIDRSISYEEVARLAHRFYEERGRTHGHHIEDWFRAEQELLGKAS
jgi:sigma54-dependent transcription regulator